MEWGREAARQIVAEGGLPDAIVCANDSVALGVLDVLRSQKVRVPEDVLLTGFDDTELASIAWPPLTSVRQPFEMIGRKGAELVLSGPEAMAGNSVSLFAAELRVRQSSRRQT